VKCQAGSISETVAWSSQTMFILFNWLHFTQASHTGSNHVKRIGKTVEKGCMHAGIQGCLWSDLCISRGQSNPMVNATIYECGLWAKHNRVTSDRTAACLGVGKGLERGSGAARTCQSSGIAFCDKFLARRDLPALESPIMRMRTCPSIMS
jgi:hypothetical protein